MTALFDLEPKAPILAAHATAKADLFRALVSSVQGDSARSLAQFPDLMRAYLERITPMAPPTIYALMPDTASRLLS